MDLDFSLDPDFCDLDRDLEREPFLEPDKDLDFDLDFERDKAFLSREGDLDCFLDPDLDLDFDLDFLSAELERDLKPGLFSKSGEPFLELFTERDLDCLAIVGDRFGDAEGDRESFLDPDKDLDLDLELALTSFGLADPDLDLDLVWKDLGVPDRERE